MRKIVLFVVSVLLPVISMLWITTSYAQDAEVEMDMDLMQTIEDTNDSLSSNIAMEETDASLADAQLLNELFVVVEKHFIDQGTAPEAVELSTKSLQLSREIITQVEKSDFESAANTATDLARTCKTCHNFYKED
jgi:hypothetical protein